MNISGKGWRASPPARRPVTPRARPKKTTYFALSGQPGPAHLKRAGPKRAGLARFDTPISNHKSFK